MRSYLSNYLVQGNGRLHPPVITLLHHAFRFERHTLEKTRWIVYDQTLLSRSWAKLTGIPQKTSAAVLGYLVIYDGFTEMSDQDWFRLLVHEQVHICQIAQMGVVPFYFRYLLEAARKTYRDIRFEKEAFRYGYDPNGDDLALKLWQYRQHAVNKILSDQVLNDRDKSLELAELGKRFHREVNKIDLSSSFRN